MRRDRIIATAIDAIDAAGTISVAAIADEAGVPRSVVYKLFENRDDLDEQIRVRIVNILMAHLAPALDPQGTVKDAIRLATATYVGWVAQHPHLQRFLGAGSVTQRSAASPVVTGTRKAIALDLAQLVESELAQLSSGGAPTGSGQDLAFGIVGLVDGAVNRWVAHPESRSSAADLVDFLSEAVWSVLVSHAERMGVPLTADQLRLSSQLRAEDSDSAENCELKRIRPL